MSYTDVFSLNELICPYCKRASTPIPMTPLKRYEPECVECGHKFYAKRGVRTDYTSGAYHAAPCCTLNGFEHDIITKTSKGQDYSFCAVCDKEA